jgi:hypothetical protein
VTACRLNVLPKLSAPPSGVGAEEEIGIAAENRRTKNFNFFISIMFEFFLY